VSARQALKAKLEGEGRDDPRWEGSRFEALERFVTETLAGPEQVALKLVAPLETADRLLARLGERLAERQDVLAQDRDTLEHLRAQIDDARTGLAEGYGRHLDAVYDVFADVRRRGLQFLDDTIRVSRIGLLRDRERFRRQFSDEVVRETTRQVERVVTDAVDDLLTRAMQLQQDLFRTFAARVQEGERRQDRFAADRGFAYDRREVFDGIMRQAERQIRSHDVRHEVGRIVDNVYSDTTLVMGAGVGAAAAGGLGAVLLVTSALDALGGLGLATGAAAALYGATVLPRQRAKAKGEFTDRIDTLQDEVAGALRERLDREIEAALERVWATVEPFAGFVEEEEEALSDAETRRAELVEDTERLREAVYQDVGRPPVG
jgi:hypothetical protein